eukprot:4700782-Pyramimonas_sp.AAC.1
MARAAHERRARCAPRALPCRAPRAVPRRLARAFLHRAACASGAGPRAPCLARHGACGAAPISASLLVPLLPFSSLLPSPIYMQGVPEKEGRRGKMQREGKGGRRVRRRRGRRSGGGRRTRGDGYDIIGDNGNGGRIDARTPLQRFPGRRVQRSCS